MSEYAIPGWEDLIYYVVNILQNLFLHSKFEGLFETSVLWKTYTPRNKMGLKSYNSLNSGAGTQRWVSRMEKKAKKTEPNTYNNYVFTLKTR